MKTKLFMMFSGYKINFTLLISLMVFSCYEKRAGTVENSVVVYSDSTRIEPVKNFQFFKAKYVEDRFYILKDFGSVIQVYAKDSKINEMNVVKLQQSGNTYILAGVGSTIDFFLMDQKIVCFQKTPNQVKVLDINSGEVLETSSMDLPMMWVVQQVVKITEKEFLVQVFDPDLPQLLRIYKFDFDTKKSEIFLEEELAGSTNDGVLTMDGPKLLFLGKSEKHIYGFDTNTGKSSLLVIPELAEREYLERPGFKSENPFEWLDLSREERVEYRTDHYKSLYLRDDAVYLGHYVYQRENFDLNRESFLYSKNKLGEPADVVGFLDGYKYLEFDGRGNYIALVERLGELMLIINPLENLEKKYFHKVSSLPEHFFKAPNQE